MDTQQGGDQRVTNAIVKRDLDDLKKTIGDLVSEVREHNRCSEQRFQALEKADAVQDKDIEQIVEDVKTLKSRDTVGTIGATLLAFASGIVALFKP